MKSLKFILPAIIIIGIIGSGYFAYKNGYLNFASTERSTEAIIDNEEESEEVAQIKDDSEYEQEVALVMQDYADAVLLLSAIVNVDLETIEAEKWTEMIDINYKKWQSVEERTTKISEYLNQKEAGLFPTVYAQDMSDLEHFTMPDETPTLTTTSFDDDEMGTEVELKKPETFEESMSGQTMKVVNEVSKDPLLERIMKRWGTNDARFAMELLEQARVDYQLHLNDELKQTAAQAEMLTKVRNYSFTTVAALGVVASGSTLLGAAGTSAWGFTEYVAASNLVFGGMDMVFIAGENGYIVDNREGRALFKELREDYSLPNKVIGFVSLKDPSNLGGNMITLYGYNEAIRGIRQDQQSYDQEQAYNLLYDSNKDFIDMQRDPELLKELMVDEYKIEGVKIDIPEPELPPADIPDGPSIESMRMGQYTSEIVIVDDLTGITSSGPFTFIIDENGNATGNATLTFGGTTMMPGVETTTSGSMNGSVEGTFDWESQSLNMSGTYITSSTTTAMGHSTQTSDRGTVTVNAVFSNGQFVGTLTGSSELGHSSTAEWTATKN